MVHIINQSTVMNHGRLWSPCVAMALANDQRYGSRFVGFTVSSTGEVAIQDQFSNFQASKGCFPLLLQKHAHGTNISHLGNQVLEKRCV